MVNTISEILDDIKNGSKTEIKELISKELHNRLDEPLETNKKKFEKYINASIQGTNQNKKAVFIKAKTPDLKTSDRTLTVVKERVKSPQGKEIIQSLYNQYRDYCILKLCNEANSKIKNFEEAKIVYESIVRGTYNKLANDLLLKQRISNKLENTLNNTIIASIQKNSIGSLNYSDKLTSSIDVKMDSLYNNISKYNEKKIIDFTKNTIDHTLNNITNIVSNNKTLDTLSKMPIIGYYFGDLQQYTSNLIKTSGNSWYVKEYSKVIKYTKMITTVQKTINVYHKRIQDTINKARQQAQHYIRRFEKQAIDRIKKYINLNNLSIGGFKFK